MWSDNETQLDLLNIRYLVSAVTDTVQNADLLPTTVGVFGDWGSGKSSILAMAQKQLEQDGDVLCLTFNGWLFEGYEDAKAALMGAILDGIREERAIGPKAKELLGKLAKRIDWFSAMGLAAKYGPALAVGDPDLLATQMAGLSGQDVGETVAKVAKEVPKAAKEAADDGTGQAERRRKSVQGFREDFEALLQETKTKSLVVFIDDLDRCLPDTVIETLEAVRLFLYVRGTAFVICADERLVEHAVQRRFPEPIGARSEVAQNYLEKLVQIPIRIPPLGPSEVRTYMNLLFAQLRLGGRFTKVYESAFQNARGVSVSAVLDYGWFKANVDDIPEELKEDLDLTERIGGHVGEMLSGNPRQVKRFLNALLLRMQMSEKRGVKLRQGVLAKLMVLEYRKQETFRQLANLQGAQDGKPSELGILEHRARRDAAAGTSEDGAKVGDDGGEAVDAGYEAWLEDEWMLGWLASEPLLGGEDLRPYFYVARDRIGVIAGPRLQLSPQARETLEKILSASAAERKAGLDAASSLSPGDASPILQVLVDRARRSDDARGDAGPVSVLLAYAEKRPELADQAVLSLKRIPESRIGLGVPARLVELMGSITSVRQVCQAQLEAWCASDNTRLAHAAASSAKRIKEAE